ncbi:cupin [Saccharomonospora sp. CUA-673]|uniref:cupin domain-containing protein n=1 Tax=Saccharomonospora sp. CUA-673 TaxID=1904969 RepID=UPI00095F0D22|nr:cupin domain-containing protein [Saccharomonospora sp. CUA-673]OLT48921.1 cupin [Saccharomonospora sp. CUA-673]
MSTPNRPPLAAALDLEPHPEGGWYRRTWASDHTHRPEGYPGDRPLATGIHYLLEADQESAWHRVRSDELWLWHRGGPLTLLLGGSGDEPAPNPQRHVLGPDVEHGQHLQVLVPGDVWQSARPAADEEVLVSCIVSPGFDFADFTMLPRD